MAVSSSSVLFLCLLSLAQPLHSLSASPYLFPSTLFDNYEKMLTTFRIYMYTPQKPFTFTTPPLSLFHTSLLNSPFLTQNADEAHLFYISFPPDLSTRSRARLVRHLRISYPYWNRTLGADHFFMAPGGVDSSSDRNAVELKKNSVQISIFPTASGDFIPHKDITLPPVNPSPLALVQGPGNDTASHLGFMVWDGKLLEYNYLVNEMKRDPEFRIESEPSDHVDLVKDSKFCLFLYGGEMTWMVEAMALGCVPVVLVDRPVQDFPLTDVLRWSDMGLLVRTRGGLKRLKAVLNGVGGDRYQQMRELGVAASRHLVWNLEPQPYDAFHMVMYQLWLRRHTIRYARREWV
ncbi:probable glycosyltransferase At5g03795 [Coffea arabica]|uniref:Probable glycosyltransferase At5g03795 n=1 Tax=Coffea arabica TaxID=13443 RepID=A0ABM4WDW6_COFAR|nr:probable glycosyltransferase At5g03795 [Coffea arabica]